MSNPEHDPKRILLRNETNEDEHIAAIVQTTMYLFEVNKLKAYVPDYAITHVSERYGLSEAHCRKIRDVVQS